MKVFVHLGHGFDAAEHRKRYEAGLNPDVVPYGFHHAESMGCVVTYSSDAPEGVAMNTVRRGLARLLGFDLVHAFRNRNALLAADVIWTMEERQYLAVAALVSLFRDRTPRLIAQTVWLFDRWNETPRVKRSAILRPLVRRADRLTVHSQEYLPVISALIPGARPELLRFGISLDTFPFTPAVAREIHRPIRVLSAGMDRTRDWPTVLAAFGNDDRFELTVVTQSIPRSTLAEYDNVLAPQNPTMQEFRALYEWADYVVIALKPNLYSGITVALEATAMGAPVVCSATGGVPTYFGADEVLYVSPGNPQALRDAVLGCTSTARLQQVRRAQERFLREDYSSEGMARRYVELSRELLRSTKS